VRPSGRKLDYWGCTLEEDIGTLAASSPSLSPSLSLLLSLSLSLSLLSGHEVSTLFYFAFPP
jgi:hypothetical protein